MKASKANIKRLLAGKPPIPSEEATQEAIILFLEAHGVVVTVTTRRVKKCWQCHAFPKSGFGDGTTKGLSDLIVRLPTWPRGVTLALEVKRPGSIRYSSNEQKAAACVGSIIVVQSLEEAWEAVQEADAMIGHAVPMDPDLDATKHEPPF